MINIMDFWINLFDAIMWVIFLTLFHGGRRGKPQLLIGASAAAAGLVLSIEITGRSALYSHLTLPIDLVILCIYSFCLLKESWYWKLFTILLYNISIFSCNSCCFSFFTNILHISSERLLDSQSGMRWCFVAASKILLLAVGGEVLLCKQRLVKLKKYSWFLLILSIVEISIISFIMEIFSYFYNIKGGVLGIITLMSLIVVLFLLCFYFWLEATKVWEQKVQNEILKKQISTRNQIYDEQDKDIQQIRHVQHDIKHKLVVVEQLLFENNYEGARNYLHKFLKDMENVGNIDCKETVWKTLLSMKQSRAQEKGIQCFMDIKEHGIEKMNAIDLCVLLGNLMDNAIEAEEKVTGEKTICFMLREEELVFIQVKNRSYESKDVKRLTTTKPNTKLHGFGVVSIKEIVNKYGGTYKIESSESWFQVEIIL